jgi:hypothetical protein
MTDDHAGHEAPTDARARRPVPQGETTPRCMPALAIPVSEGGGKRCPPVKPPVFPPGDRYVGEIGGCWLAEAAAEDAGAADPCAWTCARSTARSLLVERERAVNEEASERRRSLADGRPLGWGVRGVAVRSRRAPCADHRRALDLR